MCLGPDEKAVAFLERVVDPDFALGAYREDGRLVGIAGYKTKEGAFVGGGLADIAAIYEWGGALWRILLLSTVERPVERGRLLMDGICVRPEMRGQGVGAALLAAIISLADQRGATEVRLDVIDRNARARALYERHGFRAAGEQSTGPLRHVFGFSHATTMLRAVST